MLQNMPDKNVAVKPYPDQRGMLQVPPHLSLEYTEMDMMQNTEHSQFQRKTIQHPPTLSLTETDSVLGSQFIEAGMSRQKKPKKDLSHNRLSKGYDSSDESDTTKRIDESIAKANDEVAVTLQSKLEVSKDRRSEPSRRKKKKSRNDRKSLRGNREQLLIAADIDVL